MVEAQASSKDEVSFMRSLCMGQIEEDLILPFPDLEPTEKETLREVGRSLEGLLGPLTEEFRKWDAAGEFPGEFIEDLRRSGLFGLVTPEEYGGLGFGSAAYSRALQEVARYDGSVAVTIGAHNSIGMRGLLLFGTDEQKARYLPRLASGELIAAFCLTEPGAGSDAASIKTSAVRDGADWILNGNKLWITNGGIADFFTVFARTDPDTERGHMSAFIVTRDMPGVTVGPHEDKMGLRANPTTTAHFDNVRVPETNLLGERGKGFKIAMSILNNGRSGLGGGSVGGIKRLIALATKQANERRQFGRPIREFGLVKQKIGQMVVDCYATEATVSMVAAFADHGIADYAVEAAISKVFASEALWRAADESLQIAGGAGFMRDYPYERVVRDARINRIFEGTNEILRLFIALTGMQDVGFELKNLADSLQGVFTDPIKGFGVLSDYARKRASLLTAYTFTRAKTGFTRLDPQLKPQQQAFEDCTRGLASATDRVLRKHGKNIIGKQLASKRLADIMIDLFVWACVISRVDTALKRQGKAAAMEVDVLQIFGYQARTRIRENLAAIDDNEDEALKAVADHAFELERFAWDTI